MTADATRLRIINSARHVFAELGYYSTTFRSVADRAELTRPCISYHFATKQALYRAVGGQVLSEVIAASIAVAGRENGLVAKVSGFIAHLERADAELPGPSSPSHPNGWSAPTERRPDVFVLGAPCKAGAPTGFS